MTQWKKRLEEKLSGLEQKLLNIDSTVIAIQREVRGLQNPKRISKLETSVKGLYTKLDHYDIDFKKLQMTVENIDN